MNRYIYIFIEIGRRELDARLAIALNLAKKGYKIVIGEKNQLLWDILAGRYPPGVILDKCAQITTARYFPTIIRRGFIYTVMDEEGLITSKEYFNNFRFSREAEKYVSVNFMVSQLRSEDLLSDYPNAKNIVVGNPRYSMLRPEWKFWFEDEYNIIKEKYGKFVLIVSSFNSYPQVYDQMIDGMFEVDNLLKRRVEQFVTENKESGVGFVYRPHPSDQDYKNNNVTIDSRFNIIPWIMASEYILNAKCTTSLEAFVAGKRAYTWKFPTKEKAYKIANIFADDIKHIGMEENENISNRRATILNKMIESFDDPFLSLNVICGKLEELSFETDRRIRNYSIAQLMHMKNRIRYIIRKDNYKRIVQKFTEDDINYAYNKIKGKFDKVKIDKLVLELN
jgi:surface carbohydrate biosynthesis protein